MRVVARLEEQQRCERVKKDDLKAVGEKTIYADIQRCTDEILRLDKEIFERASNSPRSGTAATRALDAKILRVEFAVSCMEPAIMNPARAGRLGRVDVIDSDDAPS